MNVSHISSLSYFSYKIEYRSEEDSLLYIYRNNLQQM
jgi:hypothetical protein